MFKKLSRKIISLITHWLMHDTTELREFPLSDFERLKYEIRPCDVLLVEGRSRVSEVIRLVTQSSWTHAALYVGRLHDIEDPQMRERVLQFYNGDPSTQLVIESVMGKGTIISPLNEYHAEHMRICRPIGITRQDAQSVLKYVINRLGYAYDVRQIFDLARFLFPWAIWPRKWRSSLFRHNAGQATKDSCATLIAEAFSSVKFPILPMIKETPEAGVQWIQRNPRLFTPSDFDYSPYFEIIKYPMFNYSTDSSYRQLPWSNDE